ncbi:hypothetical protein L917_16388 [Phytophthora nicotianae]|uniref:Uncharacterized protein n=1 Tax=Phytophthora nicotianae TaxID=4792 RepID=W2KGF6_PHYNI|nr:hypothetical protein L917_16388 [Phytophthora nicotianae]
MTKLGLMRLYGQDQLVLHAFFDDLPVAGAFVRDYAPNANRGVYRKYAYGNMKTWVCTSHSCGWLVSLTKKRASVASAGKVKKVMKLSHVPSGAYYISKLNLTPSQCCTSSPDVNARQLKELTGFTAAILEDHSPGLTRVVNSVDKADDINMKSKHAVVYRAIQEVKASLTVSPEVEYSLLPGFMEAFAEANPGSRVCLELDSRNSLVRIQDAILPVWEVDERT